jgi:hypothetical protein
MQFRNDRRRRVFTDESTSAGADSASAEREAPDSGATAAGTGVRYGEAARRDRQPRLTDLVPSRYLTLSLLLGANLLFVTLLLTAYTWQVQLAAVVGGEAAAALDLAERGSLATWFNSLVLFSTAGVALLVYSLRRHRVDDYHGRYRVWLWAMLACLLLSIDETTAAHRVLYVAVGRLAAWVGVSSVALGRSVLAVMLCGFAVRLLVEMWRCRAACSALACAAGLLTASVAIQVEWIAVDNVMRQTMLASGLQMLGHLGLLAALMLYARHVILDVEGLLPIRVKKVKVKKPKAAKKPARPVAEDSDKPAVDPPQKVNKPHVPAKTDLEPATAPAAVHRHAAATKPPVASPARPAPTPAAKVATPVPSASSDDDDEDDDSPANRGMSRADRKKLRRQMRRQAGDDD